MPKRQLVPPTIPSCRQGGLGRRGPQQIRLVAQGARKPSQPAARVRGGGAAPEAVAAATTRASQVLAEKSSGSTQQVCNLPPPGGRCRRPPPNHNCLALPRRRMGGSPARALRAQERSLLSAPLHMWQVASCQHVRRPLQWQTQGGAPAAAQLPLLCRHGTRAVPARDRHPTARSWSFGGPKLSCDRRAWLLLPAGGDRVARAWPAAQGASVCARAAATGGLRAQLWLLPWVPRVPWMPKGAGPPAPSACSQCVLWRRVVPPGNVVVALRAAQPARPSLGALAHSPT